MLACCSFFTIVPAHAFTADSLDIMVSENGDAVATFRFTLEGIIENAIPQSVLEEKLVAGLSTSSEPPELKSMDRSSAVLLLKKFADTTDVPTGTSYLTATMDFKKAEIALENSGLGGAISADFSPEKITVTFPDSYKREYSNADVLPAISHIVIDPSKTPQPTLNPDTGITPGAFALPLVTPQSSAYGSMNVTSSPENLQVYVDSQYVGTAPAVFPEISSGTHTVEFRKQGFESVSKTVTIISGRTTNVMVVLKYVPSATAEETSSFPWLPVLVVFIGLVAVVIGGYYFWTEKKRNDWGKSEDTKTGKNGARTPARPEKIVKDIVISDGAARKPAITAATAAPVAPAPEVPSDPTPSAGTAVPVVTPPAAETEPKKAAAGDTTVRKQKGAGSVVRVTLLKDIPKKGPGDNGTNENHR